MIGRGLQPRTRVLWYYGIITMLYEPLTAYDDDDVVTRAVIKMLMTTRV